MSVKDNKSSQQETINTLPRHLQPFVAFQDYSLYTARDHAAWRFLLAQLRENLSKTALPVYLEGLDKTGISLDSIPKIEDINDKLSALGWRAVVVDGFIPSAIFMEFQAIRVLVIAVNMRSFEHMLYTPAPDIVHESAGHAPFLVDVDYAEFLQAVGELGMRAVASKGDFDVYEAIRRLSIVKESAKSSAQDIEDASECLTIAVESNNPPSEMALLSRLHWWTVEYGLVGKPDNYYLFGAGLLSSLGESINCLDDEKVKKIPLTVDAIETAYDITCEQPQLFVTLNCRHLSQVLAEFGKQMCCNVGGLVAIEKAISSECINTAQLDSGVQISGVFSSVHTDAVGNISYLQVQGPTQLSYDDAQLEGQGSEYHSAGFGTAIGKLQGFERCLSSYTIDELARHGIKIGHQAELVFLSGIRVRGDLKQVLRKNQKNVLFSFSDCTVTTVAGVELFKPAWGIYDMAVGESVCSVFGGSADPSHCPLYAVPSRAGAFSPPPLLTPSPPSSPPSSLPSEYDEYHQRLFELYSKLRTFRKCVDLSQRDVQRVLDDLEKLEANRGEEQPEWLLVFEALELSEGCDFTNDFKQVIIGQLNAHMKKNSDVELLISLGLTRLGVRDSSQG